MANFFDLCFNTLKQDNIDLKIKLINEIYHLIYADKLSFETTTIVRVSDPGRPKKPNLVDFAGVPRRNTTDKGLISTIHAIAHIEFNAINLALDVIYRFQNMPKQFYYDWLKVAREEVYHFQIIRNYLLSLGYDYGDFNAHNGLWEITHKTDYDVLVRMALVPRVLEARGLDVTPGIKAKFKTSKFAQMTKILDIIYADEMTHVSIGNYWYKYLCDERGLDYMTTFDKLIKKHIGNEGLRGPFNEIARLKSGFSAKEMEMLNV
jgi:uncharacterized ferritin-like protein (DUF455 family)